MTCTVGVMVYDRVKFLHGCLKSITSQEYGDFDVIISVDYSLKQAEVLKVISGFIDIYTGLIPIKVIVHDENIGAIRNHQFLLKQASGDYFCWVSDDDLLHKNYIASLVSALKKRSDDIFCAFPAVRYINEKGEMTGSANKPSNNTQVMSLFQVLDFPGQCFWAQLGIFKREVALTYTLYPVEMQTNINTYTELIFLTKIAFCAKILFINDELLFYRVHEGSRYVLEERKVSKIGKYIRSLRLLIQIYKVIRGIWSRSDKKSAHKIAILFIITYNFLFWPLKSSVRKLWS